MIELEVDGDGHRLHLKARAKNDGRLIHADTVNIRTAQARRKFAAAVAERIDAPDADRDTIAADVERLLLAELDRKPEPPAQENGIELPDHRALLEEMSPELRTKARELLTDPDLIQRIVDHFDVLGIAGESALAMTIYLIGTSRLLSRPLAGIVQGPSSSGKSYIIDRVTVMFPAEAVVRATQMTPQALFHAKPGALVHRWVVAGERSRMANDEVAENTRALREMLSSGVLTKIMPMKVEGKIETVELHQPGPIAFVESTTLNQIFAEDVNRCLMLATDERPEQTRRILQATAAAAAGWNVGDADGIIEVHHAAQRMLAMHAGEVLVPFAYDLQKQFPANRPEARRAFPHMLSMIKTLAMLHRFQRQQTDSGVIATPDDYHIARFLLDEPMGRILGRRISPQARRLLDRLRDRFAADVAFTTRQVTDEEAVEAKTVRGYLHELHDGGDLELVERSHGPTPAVWRLVDRAEGADQGDSLLPPVEDVCGTAGYDCSAALKLTCSKDLSGTRA